MRDPFLFNIYKIIIWTGLSFVKYCFFVHNLALLLSFFVHFSYIAVVSLWKSSVFFPILVKPNKFSFTFFLFLVLFSLR